MRMAVEAVGQMILGVVIASMVLTGFLSSKHASITEIGQVAKSRAMLLPEENPIPIEDGVVEKDDLLYPQKTYITGEKYELPEELELKDSRGKSVSATMKSIVRTDGMVVKVSKKVTFVESGLYRITLDVGKKEREILIPVSGCAVG